MVKIHLNYKWDKGTFLKASYYNLQYGEISKIKRILVPLSFVLCLATLFLISKRGFKAIDISPFIILLYFYILRWPLYRLQLSTSFNKYSEKNSEINWEITDEYLKAEVKGKSQGQITWDLISKYDKTKEGYLLHRYPLFHWFPFNAFRNEADLKNFDNLLIGKIKRILNNMKRIFIETYG